MNTFTHFKIGTKIAASFLIILTLMLATGGTALMKVSQIRSTITDFADNLASDLHLADQLVIQLSQVRLYANRYIRRPNATDLKGFRDEATTLEKLVAQAIQEFPAQAQNVVAGISRGIQDYVNSFEEVIKIVDGRRKTIEDVLDVQGPIAEEKLQQLYEKTFQANEISGLFYVGNLQRILFLMRLDIFKYLASGDSLWNQKAEERYQEVQGEVKKLEDTLKDSGLSQLVKEATTAVTLYHQGVEGMRADYDRQNQLLENQFYAIGPKLQQDSSELAEMVSTGFAKGKEAANVFVTETWAQLLVMMTVTIFLGLVLGITLARGITMPLASIMAMTQQMIMGNLNQMVQMKNRGHTNQLLVRGDELGNLWRTFDALASYFQAVIQDIVRISQGLAAGNLGITLQAEYRGDFGQIKQALETALSDVKQVIEDIVQVSQGLAEGKQRVLPKADYRGDFLQIKTALTTAATTLADATVKNATQDWLKTGQALLNEQMRGEQEVMTLAKNVITFLTPYVEAQVGVFYLLEEAKEGISNQAHLKLVASYAYTQRKGLPTEFAFGEGLIGQAALEQQFILVSDVPEDYIHIESGLGEAVPQNILVMPFLYENKVKGVIELGSFLAMSDVKIEFLKQVMPSIGIVVNTAESRTKMQALLQKVR